MPVGIVFTQTARSELIDAQDWYEAELAGLGRRFRAEVHATLNRIAENPLQFPIVQNEIRRALVRRFPYSIFFVLEYNSAIVIACFHASRDPDQWKGR